jgi:two-component system chemotaxis response regulator CheY
MVATLTHSPDHHAAAPKGAAIERAQGALNILVIDDQRTMRRIIRQLLSTIHVRHIHEAADGQQALDLLNDPKTPWIDLIICDLVMEGMDGLGFLNKLRGDAALRQRHIPVLILTAEHNELLLNVVRQVGAADIAHKPISSPDLRERIERLVGVQFS